MSTPGWWFSPSLRCPPSPRQAHNFSRGGGAALSPRSCLNSALGHLLRPPGATEGGREGREGCGHGGREGGVGTGRTPGPGGRARSGATGDAPAGAGTCPERGEEEPPLSLLPPSFGLMPARRGMRGGCGSTPRGRGFVSVRQRCGGRPGDTEGILEKRFSQGAPGSCGRVEALRRLGGLGRCAEQPRGSGSRAPAAGAGWR